MAVNETAWSLANTGKPLHILYLVLHGALAHTERTPSTIAQYLEGLASGDTAWQRLEAPLAELEDMRMTTNSALQAALLRVFPIFGDVHTMTAAGMYQVAPLNVTPEMRAAAKKRNFIHLYSNGGDMIKLGDYLEKKALTETEEFQIGTMMDYLEKTSGRKVKYLGRVHDEYAFEVLRPEESQRLMSHAPMMQVRDMVRNMETAYSSARGPMQVVEATGVADDWKIKDTMSAIKVLHRIRQKVGSLVAQAESLKRRAEDLEEFIYAQEIDQRSSLPKGSTSYRKPRG